jgi:membrane protein required for colicin V production
VIDSVSWIDWALLVVLLLSIVIGLFRGLVFELMSLAGWIVAYFAAVWFAPEVAPYIPVGTQGSALNHSAALLLCFVAALIVWGLMSRLVRMMVSATPLKLIDRVLGAAFGVLRGMVLLLAVATIVALTPAARSPAWQHSVGAQWLAVTVQGLRPMLPPAITQWIPQTVRSVGRPS